MDRIRCEKMRGGTMALLESKVEPNKNSVCTDEDEPLVTTLPDGRHKTNLSKLIRTEKARHHFDQIAEVVINDDKDVEKPER